MATRKFLNDPQNIVPEMLEGIVLSRSDVKLFRSAMSVIHKKVLEKEVKQVALVSGGGAGHEPAHAGYIGEGGLSAVVCGQVYSSPTRDAIYATLSALPSNNVLLIVKNYTGDKLNFGLAAELAKTTLGKENVSMVVVADDVALLDAHVSIGARGIAGVVFVHKIAGAIAATGASLERVKNVAEWAASNVKTYGVSLSSCTLPNSSTPMFVMEEGHMEIGLGIHGEKGLGSRPKQSADEIVKTLLDKLIKYVPQSCPSTRVAVLLNNLGSTTVMEMAVLSRAILRQITNFGWELSRFYVGQCLTAMETAGISISVMAVDDELLALLDAPTTMPAWLALGNGLLHMKDAFLDEKTILGESHTQNGPIGSPTLLGKFQATETGEKDETLCALIARTLTSVCHMLKENEKYLTNLDSEVGDGDLGTNLTIAANDVLKLLPSWSTTHPATLLLQLAIQLGTSLGGTSGPLYSIFFLNLANAISSSKLDRQAWVAAAESGISGISSLGGAVVGDRTMMDALIPAVKALKSGTLQNAAQAASDGSRATANMLPKKGRSSYLQERALGVVDPGSAAVELIFKTLAQVLDS